MKKLGRVKAYDAQGKPHEFETFRSSDGIHLYLDGESHGIFGSHMNAIREIMDEAARRGYHGRRFA